MSISNYQNFNSTSPSVPVPSSQANIVFGGYKQIDGDPVGRKCTSTGICQLATTTSGACVDGENKILTPVSCTVYYIATGLPTSAAQNQLLITFKLGDLEQTQTEAYGTFSAGRGGVFSFSQDFTLLNNIDNASEGIITNLNKVLQTDYPNLPLISATTGIKIPKGTNAIFTPTPGDSDQISLLITLGALGGEVQGYVFFGGETAGNYDPTLNGIYMISASPSCLSVGTTTYSPLCVSFTMQQIGQQATPLTLQMAFSTNVAGNSNQFPPLNYVNPITNVASYLFNTPLSLNGQGAPFSWFFQQLTLSANANIQVTDGSILYNDTTNTYSYLQVIPSYDCTCLFNFGTWQFSDSTDADAIEVTFTATARSFNITALQLVFDFSKLPGSLQSQFNNNQLQLSAIVELGSSTGDEILPFWTAMKFPQTVSSLVIPSCSYSYTQAGDTITLNLIMLSNIVTIPGNIVYGVDGNSVDFIGVVPGLYNNIPEGSGAVGFSLTWQYYPQTAQGGSFTISISGPSENCPSAIIEYLNSFPPMDCSPPAQGPVTISLNFNSSDQTFQALNAGTNNIITIYGAAYNNGSDIMAYGTPALQPGIAVLYS